MKSLILIFGFLLSAYSPAYADNGVVTNYLRIAPTTLPSTCHNGDIRFGSVSLALEYCNSNTWSAFGAISTPVSIANGGTGQATATAALTALLPTQSGNNGYVLGTNGTSASWVSPGGLAAIGSYSTYSNNTSSSAPPTAVQSLTLGTPSISDSGIATQFTQSVAGYFQHLLQNTSNGTGSSADIIVSNNLGTASTYYGDFGINSSTYTGSGALNLPNATYLYSETGDLVLGTNTANAVHILANGSTTDAITVNSSNAVITPGLTGYLYGNGGSAVTASTSISGSNISGAVTTATNLASGAAGSLPYQTASGTTAMLAAGTGGYYLMSNGTSAPSWSPVSGSGTVTNVGLTVPSFLSVSGSPITGAGTFALSLSGTALPTANGGTGQTSLNSTVFTTLWETIATTLGDLVYGGTSGAPTRLAGNTSSTLKVLAQTGTGTVSAAPSWTTLATLGTIDKVVVQSQTSSGTYTPTTGMVYVTVECIGNGGGGGATASTSSAQMAWAGGGGGGEYVRKTLTAATVGSSQTVTIGTTGAGGSGGGANAGTTGGNVTFGSLITAHGGGGGTGATGVSNTGSYGAANGGGTGGTGGSGDVVVKGGSGLFGVSINTAGYSGSGGTSYFGTGASPVTGTSAGNGGNGYGSGGSGGGTNGTSGGASGGTGTTGGCWETEFISQ